MTSRLPVFTLPALLYAVILAMPLTAQSQGRMLSETERDTLFSAFESRLGAVVSMKAPFVQEREIPLSDDKLVSTGVCRYKAPSSLRWEYREPYRTLLIYKDGKAAKFDVVDGKLRKMPNQQDALAMVMGEILFWMKGDFTRTKDFYNIEVRETGTNYLVTLVPRTKALSNFISSIQLTFDLKSYFVTSVVLTGAAEDKVYIHFSGQENNLPADDALFSLTSPSLP